MMPRKSGSERAKIDLGSQLALAKGDFTLCKSALKTHMSAGNGTW